MYLLLQWLQPDLMQERTHRHSASGRTEARTQESSSKTQSRSLEGSITGLTDLGQQLVHRG